MVVKGLLEIDAIGPYLMLDLREQDFEASLFPPGRCGNFGAQCANEEERKGLADQVSIRRKVRGEISFDVPAVPGESAKQVGMKFGRNDGINWQQITDPNPRHAAKCDFKAAAPINAERVRIGSLPGIELFFDFANVFRIAGESECPGKSDQMLMPV